jgi:hypothetical protein
MTPLRARRRKDIVHIAARPKQCMSFVYSLVCRSQFVLRWIRPGSHSISGIIETSFAGIPHSGYISPEAMVTYISALIRLEELALDFESPGSLTVWECRRLFPHTRTLFPALRIFEFQWGERILGGPRGPRRRYPFTRQVACNSHISTHIRHFTTRTAHRSHTNVHDTR